MIPTIQKPVFLLLYLDSQDGFVENHALAHAVREPEQLDELVKLSTNGVLSRAYIRLSQEQRTLSLTSFRRIFSRDFFL